MNEKVGNPFHQWSRLEQPRLGSRVVFATDDFFAPKERLILPTEPVFIPGKYDEHGKWMDGWESRRKRVSGHDCAIVRLGIPGLIRGFDIDTRHFTGNYPPAASIDVCVSDDEVPDESAWQELVPRRELEGDSHHYVAAESDGSVTHCRLNIYPDGGVARLRIYGEVRPLPARFSRDDVIDLFAIENGGRAVACNDEHFGSMHNLNLPGRGINMGDGWETARRRQPGNDWVVLKLGCPGTIERVQIDTAHFKGNYPDRAELRAAMMTGNEDFEASSGDWPVLLAATQLEADCVHEFAAELADVGIVSHLRLNIFPDGGVSRLRVFGRPAEHDDG